MFIEFETEIIFWVRLFRSENYDALAVFSQKMAARPKENLHPTTLRPKGRKDAERTPKEKYFIFIEYLN